MKIDAFDLGKALLSHRNTFNMYPPLWAEFSCSAFDVTKAKWKEVKYLNDVGDDFSDEVKNMPNNKGGIYMYIVKSPVLPDISNYLVYIGRAQLGLSHSLRVRCKRYFTDWKRDIERPKISVMVANYKDHLFLRYTEIDGDDVIKEVEAKLINALLPPFNDAIPDKKIRDAKKAFS